MAEGSKIYKYGENHNVLSF